MVFESGEEVMSQQDPGTPPDLVGGSEKRVSPHLTTLQLLADPSIRKADQESIRSAMAPSIPNEHFRGGPFSGVGTLPPTHPGLRPTRSFPVVENIELEVVRSLSQNLMTHHQLFQLHESLCSQARELMRKKNQDYTAGSADCFANFRSAEFLEISPEVGILLRCLDKFKRILAFSKSGTLSVANESVMDSIRDIINYMVLVAGLIQEKNPPKKG